MYGRFALAMALAAILMPAVARAQLPALLNYESKPDELVRKEGLAIIELDPASPEYGQILSDFPLPPNLVAHHIYFNPDQTRGYITSLGRRELRLMDLTRKSPYSFLTRAMPIGACEGGENIIFSEAQGRWYLTCLASSTLVVGDLQTDQVLATLALPAPWPHGLALREDLDRLLVTSSISPDLQDGGEEIVVLRASTLEVLSRHKVSNQPSPSKAAPVEIVFVPGVEPPVAYITNLKEGTLWKASWQPGSETFAFVQVEDFGRLGQALPLEIYFDPEHDRAFITTASPGHFNIFDISNPHAPQHLKAIEAAPGAHHVVFSPDGKRAYVQNSLLNIPGASDGSVSVIDLEAGEKIDSIDVLKDAGFNPNSIILLPGYGDGHGH